MKPIRNAILGIMLAIGATGAADAQNGIHNPMTQAVLQVYEEELRENPDNYSVLLMRADEYYRHQEYIRALADIDRALTLIPARETESILQARMLRAGIHNQSGRSAEALADLEAAALLAPESVSVLLQKGNTEVELGNTADARADFQKVLSLTPRSAEAYIGLAKVAVKENNMGTANEMLASAVNIDPSNPDTYIRRAAVRKSMGNHNGAVDDLVLALSVNAENPVALSELVAYGNTNYPAAMAGLSNAVTAAPQVGLYRYLRAGIAQSHYHYLAALKDYEYIIEQRIYNYHGIYGSIAECQFALGRYQEALASVDRALGMVRDNASYFVLRSRILRVLGRAEEAVAAAAAALAVDRSSGDALTEMALAYIATGKYDDADALLAEAIVGDAEDPRFPMLRAWLMERFMNNAQGAAQLYRRVADMDHFFIDNPKSLKGFALLFLGEKDQATRWMNNILATVDDHDGLIHYFGACFFAQADNTEKALECTRKALELGYGDYYDWTDLNDGRINVGGLRDDLRFLNLLSRHNSIFGR